MQLTLLVLAVGASLCMGTLLESPGLVIMKSQESLSKWHHNVILGSRLKEKLIDVIIPPIHGNLSTIFGSTVKFYLSDMELESHELTKSDVTITSENGIWLNAEVSTMTFKGIHETQFDNGFSDEYKWNGNFTLVINDMSLKIRREIVAVDMAKVRWESTEMTGLIRDVEVYTNDPKLNDLLAMIYSNDVEQLILSHFLDAYKNLTEYEVDLSIKLTPDISFDMSLVNVTMHDGDVECLHKADAIFKGDDSRFKDDGEPIEIDFFHPNKPMLYRITKLPFNSVAYFAHKHDLLSSNFTKEDLPDNYKHRLDMTCEKENDCFGKLFPEAAKDFPGSSVEIDIKTASPPHVNITGESFKFFLELNCSAKAMKTDDKTPKEVFTVLLHMSSNVHSSAKDSRIHFGLQRIVSTVDTIDSNIGELPTENVLTMCHLAVEKMLMPILLETKVKGLDLHLPESFLVRYSEWKLENNVATLMMDL